MNFFVGLFVCVSLTLCQSQDINSTVGADVTVPAVLPSLVPDNVTISVNDTAAIENVANFGSNVIFIITEKLDTLPPELRPAGEKIIGDAKFGIEKCGQNFRETGIVWEYKVCCSSYLRYGMSAFAELAEETVRSGAARPTLFFL